VSASGEGRIAVVRAADRCHQQYLAKNPAGYCGIGGTGVSCPVGFTEAIEQAASRTQSQ